ncbi:MAG: alpha/beta fold hydrolase, partial [Gemmatimonadales bacterium]|nr:alpha/beta fold hydrolase [Gemmatimonadales bacterium]
MERTANVVKSGASRPMSARAWLRGLVASALVDPAVSHLADRLPHRLVLVIDESSLPVSVGTDDGSIVSAHAPLAIWREMLVALPAPGRQSMGAALRADCGFELRGQPLAIAQAIPLLELLIEAMRAAASGPAEVAEPAPVALGRLESRYRRIDWPANDHCWIFEEAAGDPSQPVLLLLHTAGADSRQWHALMTDAELGRHWRLIAFDMPCHGRSRPPAGWRGEPWQLDTAGYLACIRAWMQAAGHARVAIAGCSMGSAIGLAFLA